MNTPDFPTKEDGYRFLKAGEFIQQTDEFWDAFSKEWVEVSATSGLVLDAASVGHFRRIKK